MKQETIILELLTGDGQGIRAARFLQSWTGQAFAAPRTEVKELLVHSLDGRKCGSSGLMRW
jgi:hypothetical protein